MNAETQKPTFVDRLKATPWSLWTQQVLSILRLELKKTVMGRRFIGMVILAGIPVFLFFLRTLVDVPDEAVQSLGGLAVIFAAIFRTFIIRLIVFFGCVFVFSNLIRGDILEKTIHFYFLAPVKREVLAVGKFVSGVSTTGILFSLMTLFAFFLHYLPAGPGEMQKFFVNGPGFFHLAGYLVVIWVACIGYGAVFLLMGMLFRNPIIPAVLILGWESINFLLPAMLKKISIIYYLESLCPVPLPPGPITLLADPAPIWVSIPGLLVVTAVILVIAGIKLRGMEISYSSD